MSDSLQPNELQQARLPCPLPTPQAYSNLCPSSRCCHPTISSSIVRFFFQPQSFPASGSFQMSQFFTSGGWSIGVSASTSVIPMNIQDWFPLDRLDLLAFQGTLKSLLQHHSFKSINSLVLSFLCGLTHIHTWLVERPYPRIYGPLSAKWCLCFLIHCLGLS